jgi:methionyl-tRNA formyltransferase
MQMDEGLDTGAVLASARVAIGPETTSAQLHDQLAETGASELLRALKGLCAGTLKAQMQPAAGVTYAEKISKAEAVVDWQRPAAQIDRQIRAFNPWPAAQTQLRGQAVKLLRSRVSTANGAPRDAVPGTLLGMQGDALEVACGSGVLQVLELQRAGRRAMPARDFCNALQLSAESRVRFQ